MTLSYQFQVHPELEPADYTLAHTVFYHSEVEAFSSTFFNQVLKGSVHVILRALVLCLLFVDGRDV